MALLLIALTLLVIGAALEATRPLLPEFFARMHREGDLRETIRLAQTDCAEARKRAEGFSGAAKAIRQEIARAKEAHDEVEREIEQRKEVPPVLVFPVGSGAGGAGSRTFRAPIGKKLKHDPEPNQKIIWSRPCFVEVSCFSAAEAKIEAHLQFPAAHGYVIGPFVELTDGEAAPAGAAGEAA